MNKYIRNFFFAGLKKQTQNEMKAKLPTVDCGAFLSISFYVTIDRVVQRVVFERIKDDIVLDDAAISRFTSLTGLDIKKEIASEKDKGCTHAVAVIDVVKKIIFIEYFYTNSEPKKIFI